MEQIRSFIAIELPDGLKRELARLESKLKSGEQPLVKWVAPEGIHLTLKFLGSIAAGRIEEITRAIEAAAEGIPPFRLEVKGLGVFPNLRRVQVAWVRVSGEVDKLNQLQQRLEPNLARLGFEPESRPFVSHLTIARLRDQASADERQRFGQLITSTSFEASPFGVDAVSLMKSQLTKTGAIYSRIASVNLKKSLPTTTS
ncbi:MAG: RNA 2',3'-cyclic phosphodiesterase [Dehalococcoidales bacterium]|nr:RNA 2',3'-cyclic phosphodiesterase [Dehalococcoidales bacterium]